MVKKENVRLPNNHAVKPINFKDIKVGDSSLNRVIMTFCMVAFLAISFTWWHDPPKITPYTVQLERVYDLLLDHLGVDKRGLVVESELEAKVQTMTRTATETRTVTYTTTRTMTITEIVRETTISTPALSDLIGGLDSIYCAAAGGVTSSQKPFEGNMVELD